MSDKVDIYEVLQARLSAAQHSLNLKDLDGLKYSLLIALKVIEQNSSNPITPIN